MNSPPSTAEVVISPELNTSPSFKVKLPTVPPSLLFKVPALTSAKVSVAWLSIVPALFVIVEIVPLFVSVPILVTEF